MAMYMTAIVIGVVGGTYASVPLYKVFCQRTGFGGTTQRADDREVKEDKKSKLMGKLYEMSNAPADKKKQGHTWTDEEQASRLATLKPVPNAPLITVTFDSNVSSTTPFKFKPATRSVSVVGGETALAFFTCKNQSTSPVTGVATYNVYPPKAGLYFNKVQCFCFEEQRLLGGEEVDMPVLFYIDPEFYEDDQLDGVQDVTLSYTFFKTDEEDEDEDEDE
ncbi:hypothetical protein TrCOL_g9260 [Triparma columacea]|uniref:Cytochrome c oxidase assembly protein n=2 Tax=Triparma columacea TaxID=722753 RepID=A0A9W7G2S1_9STRA|nr:hypothetical protein TrCOL_g9260 [Triparma columacea]